MNDHVLPYLKAYAALVGSIATALLAVYAADTTVGQVLTVVSIIATGIATWAIPNKPTYTPQILGKAFAGGTFSHADEQARREDGNPHR